MNQEQQPPPQATHVHVHQAESNGMGTAAGVCSILGLVSCGVLSPIGLILGLFSMKKQPNGMAITGVILGAIGSIGYLVVFLIFGSAVFVTCASCVGLSSLVAQQAENKAAAQPAAQAIIDYYDANGSMPDDATATTLIAPHTHEGSAFRYTKGFGDTGFYIEHPGEDGAWDTDDDWQTNWDAQLGANLSNDFEFDVEFDTESDLATPAGEETEGVDEDPATGIDTDPEDGE